jgi:hypothetical protein
MHPFFLGSQSDGEFLRLKKKEQLLKTTTIFQPWDVPSTHGLKTLCTIFSSPSWKTGMACPKAARRRRRVRQKSAPVLALAPLRRCQSECHCSHCGSLPCFCQFQWDLDVAIVQLCPSPTLNVLKFWKFPLLSTPLCFLMALHNEPVLKSNTFSI